MTCDILSEKRQDVKKNVKSGNPFVLLNCRENALRVCELLGVAEGEKADLFHFILHYSFFIQHTVGLLK